MNTVAELRYELTKHENTEVAWAGSPYGRYAADADDFVSMLSEAPDDHLTAPGLVVAYADGSWIEWETDDFGERGEWVTKRPPFVGTCP